MWLWLACAPDPTDTDAPVDTDVPEVVAPDPACAAAGCVREATSLGAWSRDDLAALVDPRVVVENGYEVFVVTYVTEAGPATATITLPDGDPPDGGWPIVANAHGTIGLDDPCRLSGTVSGAGLAGLFGARGAIGVAPDYPGLGGPGVHRYLDARSEGTSVLDSLRAAAALARWRGLPTDGRAAIVGLSQGGHAALSAAALHAGYAPDVDLRAVAAAGPASVYEAQWRAGVAVDGPHQALHAMLAWSFAEAAGADAAAVWAPGVADRVDAHLTSRCGWDPDFSGDPTLYDDFPTTATEVFSPAYLNEYRSGDWSAFAFVGDGFAANRVVAWDVQTAPIAVWQGTADEVVPAAYTEAMVDDLRAGGLDVELHLVDGAGHVDTAFGFLAVPERATDDSVAWVRARLTPE